ncbi:hypothetical protein FQN50_000397 [Emmonsiellopsis sp. PD_5]|nr:hypothetical protein FQN50_000397 [Emmonsiellopsis sp. PD_5]
MEANAIYLVLSVNMTEYHWGIYVAENPTTGVIHHVNNAQGGWLYERKHSETLVLSKMLVLALKIGTIPLPQGHARIDPILGNRNMVSQDPGFRCRAWAMDGVARLHAAGVVNAPDNPAVMAKAYRLANANRANIEQGTGTFVVATL